MGVRGGMDAMAGVRVEEIYIWGFLGVSIKYNLLCCPISKP